MISNHARIGLRRCILVVAQHVELRARIARVLQSAGYAVELAESQKRALALATGGRIEAAVVVLSTDLAGLERELRDKVPRTIVLGHRTDDVMRQDHSVLGGDALSAQDVLSMQALDEQKLLDQLGRPTASPGSAGGETAPAPALKIKDCKLDLCDHTFVDGNGREVHLTRAETALLTAFVGNPCRVLSRDQMRRAVVGHGAEPYGRNVDMLIARLRRKIEPNPKSPQFILTVPGLGYKLAPRPQSVEDGESLPAIDLERPKQAQTTCFNQSGLDGVKPTSAPAQAGSPHSEPEKRQLTALSCVLVGLAALAVSLDLEDFVNLVRHFQELCTTVITSWGGVVANAVGDEILALFGYPTSHEDDAESAVHAGLNLLVNIGKLSSPCGEPLQARIAVATGSVLIGENQTVMGEATIMARRLRNITPPNSVNVTASTRKLLGSAFICDDPQFCKLEGISNPVTAYRVTEKREIESRFIGVPVSDGLSPRYCALRLAPTSVHTWIDGINAGQSNGAIFGVPLRNGGEECGPTPVILTIEDCRLDLAAHVFVDGNGREVPLTRAELSLLAVFIGSPRKVLSRDQLRRAVVGRGAEPDDRSLDMLIARLRRKIEPNPKAPRFIRCVPGVGYKFAVEPQIAEHGNGLTAMALGKL
jgi:DNA-binding response OmpR family regulator/class 3 adenylate cyclase